MDEKIGRDAHPSRQRKNIVDILRRAGYPEVADEADRTLPESVDFDHVLRFCQEQGISRDEVISRMGGSP